MRILVCGGRNYGKLNRYPDGNPIRGDDKDTEYLNVINALEILAIEYSAHFDPLDNWLPADIEIISGGATGADSVAIDWAINNWCDFKEYRADWNKHGKAAGMIRNKQMLDEGKPDLVLAFPGGKGTANMIKLAKEAGVKVIEYACLEKES